MGLISIANGFNASTAITRAWRATTNNQSIIRTSADVMYNDKYPSGMFEKSELLLDWE
jgi:hypothetical protein